MCGRYTLHTNRKKLAEAIALALPDTLEPEYNIGPGREILSIYRDQDTEANVAAMMHWGLRTPQNFHINARIETADTAPRFRDSWEHHRCLVPANGFYEWYADGITKQPYYIHPEDHALLFFAGLWYPTPSTDSAGHCILLTTEASHPVEGIHNRMPVSLPYEYRDRWLLNEMPKTEAVAIASQASFEMHTVSRRVNSVQNADSTLIEATSPLRDDQMMLF